MFLQTYILLRCFCPSVDAAQLLLQLLPFVCGPSRYCLQQPFLFCSGLALLFVRLPVCCLFPFVLAFLRLLLLVLLSLVAFEYVTLHLLYERDIILCLMFLLRQLFHLVFVFGTEDNKKAKWPWSRNKEATLR